MKLSEDTKYLVLGNIELLNYCNKCGVDINKLRKCRIDKMGNSFVFGYPKDNPPKSKQLIPLDIDIATQPYVVLIVTVDDNRLNIETTKDTIQILKK